MSHIARNATVKSWKPSALAHGAKRKSSNASMDLWSRSCGRRQPTACSRTSANCARTVCSRRIGENASGRLETGREVGRALGTPRRLRQRVAHDLFELFEIRDEPRASVDREAIQGLRPSAVGAPPRIDEAGFLEHVDVAAQVAVGQRAQPL